MKDICSIRQNVKIKSIFTNIVCKDLVVKEYWWGIKKIYFEILGKQSVELKKGIIKL